MSTDTPLIRRVRAAEADQVAALLWRVREQNLGSIPPGVHPYPSVQAWVGQVLIPHRDVWVAERAGALVGMLVLARPDWIEQLYVESTATGRGLGARLVERAKSELGGRVQLWTFQTNTGAARFYERHGFEAVEETDGDNEEGEPDVRYLFTPTTTM